MLHNDFQPERRTEREPGLILFGIAIAIVAFVGISALLLSIY